MKEKDPGIDFGTHLPLEVKEDVCEVFQRLLFERKHLENMITKMLDRGEGLNSKALLDASQRLDELVLELQKIIERYK